MYLPDISGDIPEPGNLEQFALTLLMFLTLTTVTKVITFTVNL